MAVISFLMKRYLILYLLSYSILISLAGTACAPSRAAGAAYPFPQYLTYAPGTLRPNHRTQAQQDGDVRTFYDHWKASYLKAAGQTGAGHPLYRVSIGSRDPDRTVSEGQGYGMIIVALLAGHEPEAQ